MSQPTYIVRTGTANLASVVAALSRAGARPILTQEAAAVRDADRLVLPGVGAFAAAKAALDAHGLTSALRERVEAGRPTLGICLGMQLLCASSEESPGVEGLAVVPAAIRRFAGTGVRVPQLGWNALEPTAGCRLLTPGHVYFANSFKLDRLPDGWQGAYATHGERFVAALERGPVLACQFHPELSGAFGQALLRRWLDAGERAC